jgi:hypothetical protein
LSDEVKVDVDVGDELRRCEWPHQFVLDLDNLLRSCQWFHALVVESSELRTVLLLK